MRRDEMREASERILAKVGLQGVFGVTNGGHGKVEWTFRGKLHKVIFSRTASDWRAVKNHETIMRRKLHECGAMA